MKQLLKFGRTLNLALTLESLDSQLLYCKSLSEFKQVLSQVFVTGILGHTYPASRLLDFSINSLSISIHYSHSIFLFIQKPNGFIYNTMMRGFLRSGNPQEAISLYKLMLENCDKADNYTFPILSQACGFISCVSSGDSVHCHAWKLGFVLDVYMKNHLINMYALFGNMHDAHKVFDESAVRDSVTWNTLLAGYVALGDVDESKLVFYHMPSKNAIASNSMIALFGKKGLVEEARKLFDGMSHKEIVSWTALITCYEQNERYEEALNAFVAMISSDVPIDEIISLSVLSACAKSLNLSVGEVVHGIVVKTGIHAYLNLQNALINLYSSGGNMEAAERLFNESIYIDLFSWNSLLCGYMRASDIVKAEKLFDKMPDRDIVSYSTMMSGYTQQGHFSKALTFFRAILASGIKPDDVALNSAITACTHMGAIDEGKWLHAYMKKNKMKIDDILGTSLVNMYMKFGSIESAVEVFYETKRKGISTWNALTLGYAMNGLVKESFESFEAMKAANIAPNEITFMAILGACRHMGMVQKGQELFNSMIKDHKIEPNLRHYGCMVDLLARAGRLEEAEMVIDDMPMAADASTWGALLGACKWHGNEEMGQRVGKKAIDLAPAHAGFHVLLSNIYASKGNWEVVSEIREKMMDNGMVKTPGCTVIEADGKTHEFLSGDRFHPQINRIKRVLGNINDMMKTKNREFVDKLCS